MDKKSSQTKSLLMWLVLMGALVAFLVMTTPGGSESAKVEYVSISEFIGLVKAGEVQEVTMQGPDVRGFSEGQKNSKIVYVTYSSDATRKHLVDVLNEKKVKYTDAKVDDGSTSQMLYIFMKLGMVVFFAWFILRGLKGAQSSMMNSMDQHQKTRAVLYDSEEKVTFADVAGCDEAVEECRDFVEFLRDPQKFSSLGGRIPKGVLLAGPPGTGKTLLARAIAGEAGVPFFAGNGSGFVEMFVGVGAARVRDLFLQAQKSAPCIIFIDEIDGIGRKRGGAASTGGNEEREQCLNELLSRMDGLAQNKGIIILAATNRPEILDSALKRSGRFDKEVVLPRPDLKGREAILEVHAKKYKLGPDVDLALTARRTPGMTGADLETLLNEAGLKAAKGKKEHVEMSDIEDAMDKVLMGAAQKSRVLSRRDLEFVAWHEAGHTVATWFTPYTDPLHKVSIIPRGQALGVTMNLPAEDQVLHSKNQILARIDVLLGGRIAEELKFGDVTTGAAHDLVQATMLAKAMVVDYGMTPVGARTFGLKHGIGTFLDYGQNIQDFSEATMVKIDEEIGKIVQNGYEKVKNLLESHRDMLDQLAQALLEKETLDASEVEFILGPCPTE